jgi:hypothetical protein
LGIGFGKSGQSPLFPYKIRVAFPKTEVLGKPLLLNRCVIWTQLKHFLAPGMAHNKNSGAFSHTFGSFAATEQQGIFGRTENFQGLLP